MCTEMAPRHGRSLAGAKLRSVGLLAMAWHAAARLACDPQTMLNGMSGSIDIGRYEDNLRCSWLIQARQR
jgi:hypothetical protein